MIGKIIGYELKQRFTHWTIFLFYAMLIFQGIWYTKGTFDYYVNEDLLMNSPAVFYKNLAGGGILMMIIIAVITGIVLYKDIQHKTSHWVYTLPINEKQFFLGRFTAAFLINALIALGYVLGMLLVPYSGIGESHRFGPAPIGQLLYGTLILLIPNLFLLTSIIFSLLVLTRKMAAGYLGVLVTVVFFLVMQTASESGGITPLLMLMDPFGYVATEYVNNSFDSAAKNSFYIPLKGYLLGNRLLWFTISLVLLIIAYRRFTFKHFFSGASKKKKKAFLVDETTQYEAKEISPSLSFRGSDFIRKLYSLSILEFKNVVRPISFKIILGIILLMIFLQNLVWNASYYIGPTEPLTSTMTQFRLSFGVFILILLMVWSGELFFKDRTVKIHQITDALPVPIWVTQFSRFLAMTAVAFVLAFSFVVLGMVTQLLKGAPELIDLGLYTYDLLGYNWGWLMYVAWIALVFFLAGITGNRFATHIGSVAILFATILAFELNLAEQTRFAYAAVPGLEDYSEISGYGIWKTSARWYFLMWTLLATVFVLMGIYFWQRGTSANWSQKLRLAGKQLNLIGKISTALLLVGFFVLQSFNKKQTLGLRNFTPSEEEQWEAADYEKRYNYLKQKIHPKYAKVDLALNYFPKERKATYSADIKLEYNGNTNLDTLVLNYRDFLTMEPLQSSSHKIDLVAIDSSHLVYCYRLRPSLKRGDSVQLSIKGKKQYTGFSQGGEQPQIDLTYNGSFGSVREFLPVIGYDDDRELDENRQREEQGLAKLASRVPEIEDAIENQNDFLAPDALRVKGMITISTTGGQIPIAPGKLESEWQENERNYRKYNIQKPTSFNWYMASAIYENLTTNFEGVKVQILSSPKHLFHKELFEQSVVEGIDFINKNLGGYPYKEVRVVEIPYYEDKFYAYANTIAISEKEGWYADVSNLKEQAYIKHSIYSQLIKQWLSERLTIANVQGAETLYHSLPQALALLCVGETLGEEAIGHLLQRKKDFYGKEKNNEPNTEPSVTLNDGAEYVTDGKAVVELYERIEKMGKITFIQKLRDWTREQKNGLAIFRDFYTP